MSYEKKVSAKHSAALVHYITTQMAHAGATHAQPSKVY